MFLCVGANPLVGFSPDWVGCYTHNILLSLEPPYYLMTRTRFCHLVRDGIKDESMAGPFYTKLIAEGKKAEIPKGTIGALKSIRGDEREHLAQLREIDRRLCRR